VEDKGPHDEVLLKLKIISGSVSSICAVSSEVADLSASQHLFLHFHFMVHREGVGGERERKNQPTHCCTKKYQPYQFWDKKKRCPWGRPRSSAEI